jgi:hypothetical protein
MRVRENLSGIISSIGKNNSSPIQSSQVGKVYGIITNKNTPTKDLFEREGKFNGIGTVFYLNYEQSKNVVNVDLALCQVAKPLFPNQKYYPLIGELIVLIDGPSPVSQISNNSSSKYYITPINLWNNNQHNAQPSSADDVLGKTFREKSNIKSVQPFEGDHILEGRFGNILRFGSTSRLFNNNWSKIGKEGDPITILTNYPNYNSESLDPYIEDINNDGSSIYLTSTQQINIETDRNDILNRLTKPLSVNKYFNNQLLLNSDRVVINSKKDEIMLFAKTNIEISTKNIINLNANERTHLNSPKNFIGSLPDGSLPTEPLLLGNETVKLLAEFMSVVGEFGSDTLSAISTPPGSPIVDLNAAGIKLNASINNLLKKLEKIISQHNYTS